MFSPCTKEYVHINLYFLNNQMNASVFLHTQLPCCTLRSCSHLCVSGVFTYFYSQLLNCGMWRSDSDLSPLFSRDLLCIKTTRVQIPRLPLYLSSRSPPAVPNLFSAPVSELTAVRWLQYCLCGRGQFPAQHPPPGSAPGAGAGDGSGP